MPPRRRHRKKRSERTSINDDFADAFDFLPTSPPPKPPPPPPVAPLGSSSLRRSSRLCHTHSTRRTRRGHEDDNDEGCIQEAVLRDTEAAENNDNTKKPKGVDEDEATEATVRDTIGDGGGGGADEVRDIMREVISSSSQYGYSYMNTNLIVWLLQNEAYHYMLEPWYIEEMRDLSERKRKGVTKKMVENLYEEEDRCPIILSSLTFKVFSHFMATRKLSEKHRKIRKTKSSYLAASTYDNYRSALMHLFRMSKYEVPDVFVKQLRQFMSGMRRRIQTDKVKHGDHSHQGKKRMGWDVYELMCKLLQEGENDEYTFANCFLTLEWNLMARSENVVNCHSENITWKDDALCFNFPKSKGDQYGKRSDAVWHVYATPHNPITCPHLALARYLFSNPGVLTEHEGDTEEKEENVEGMGMAANISLNEKKLFPGTSQYNRFMKIFHQVIQENEEAFRKLGVDVGDLGSHSARKGSCSFASAGSTVSPPMVSICLRALWSMGPVKERYLHYEKAGDQYLGRVVAGLNCNDSSFAVSPPYFDLTGCENAKEMQGKIDKLVQSFLYSSEKVCARVFRIFVNLFANICYHAEYLKLTIHKKNKLHASPFFTQIPSEIQTLAAVRFPWEKSEYTPIFTGIPPHVVILANFEGLKKKMEAIRSEVHDDFTEEMNHNGGRVPRGLTLLHGYVARCRRRHCHRRHRCSFLLPKPSIPPLFCVMSQKFARDTTRKSPFHLTYHLR